MFDTLEDKLNAALGPLRSRGKLDEEVISRSMREIRLALLEADVNFRVVKDFVARQGARLGQDVARSLLPASRSSRSSTRSGADGHRDSKLVFASKEPTVILLAGLQGSGKTTAAAKLALLLRRRTARRRSSPPTSSVRRPSTAAARAADPDSGLHRDGAGRGREGRIQQASAQGRDVVIVDTAGRLQIDEDLMAELGRIKDAVKPTNVLLVLDAMTGQEAVSVAEAFQERVAFDGVVLTKLDGDARGGAALSVKAVTGKPVKLASVGEKLDQLEYFYPDRMASRILGMGDVLTLIERAEEAASDEDQAAMEARMRG